MKRNWRVFWNYAWKGGRQALFGISLVPIFYVFLNPDYSRPTYWSSMATSFRIGAQIAIFCWMATTILFGAIYILRPHLLYEVKKSISFQIINGLTFMTLGLFISSKIEPMISGKTFLIENIGAGFLIGGITLMLTVFYIAYKQTHTHNLKLRAETAESNLNALKNQMQPHFLFNSLNSLAELIATDKNSASEMTQNLADLYREILESSKTQLNPITQELSIVKKYLELEKLRFGDRLDFQIDDSSHLDAVVPSLVLQTLVENAVKHGISNSIEGGVVKVEIQKLHSGFHAQVSNSGSWLKKKSSSGTGIPNTVARLDLIYGDKHAFKLENKDQTTTAQFWFSGDNHVGV